MEKMLPEALLKLIKRVEENFPEDPKMVQLFVNCFTNTLDTTVKRLPDKTTYIITGDIPAMWLRDSVAQIRPYLMAAGEDGDIADMLVGLVKKQFFYVNLDPYANAFNQEANGNCWEHDETDMGPWIWERKYELDSLCYPIQLSYLVWKNTGRPDQFDDTFVKGVRRILKVWRTEQHHEEESPYSFVRKGCYFTDTLSRNGKGALVKSGTGLIWSGFRPSDDACTYGYLIPSNMMAVVALGYGEEILRKVLKNISLAEECAKTRKQIQEGIEAFGMVEHPRCGKMYAYETDGLGHYNLMDDANSPSLLAMPYLNYCGCEDEFYVNTRKFILSGDNPFYYRGACADGVGSPHTPEDYIWHIAIVMRALTSADREEILACLEQLAGTHAGLNFMHESFHKDDPTQFTRSWFAWANSLFSALMLKLKEEEFFAFGEK